MNYQKYLFIILGIAAISWFSLILIIFRLNPCIADETPIACNSTSSLALLLFFLSAFVALTATFSLLGFGIRLWLHRYEIYLDHFNISIRQGILLTLCVESALGLLLLNALTWWSGFLLIAIIMLIELYFTRS